MSFEKLIINKEQLINVLEWFNISYSIKNKDKSDKFIINNVSGCARSKTLTAILGPSGSGKTTFLQSISCRLKNIQGRITINGQCLTADYMKEISGFLWQNNITFEFLTAKEYLQFMSTLKLYNCASSIDRKKRIENILVNLSLQKSADTTILKLSGGEKRRLFLGAELLSDPQIIFCDEPTTGLDSYNAFKIISLLKDISLTGKIIIVSIHQPSSDLINYFDKFIFLSLGNVILDGNLQYITTFFNRMNVFCPGTCNLTEFYIKQISLQPGKEEECKLRINNYREKFLSENPYNSYNMNENLKILNSQTKLKCPYYIQLLWLMWRECLILKRAILTELVTLFVLLVTATTITIFYSFANNNIKIQNIIGVLYLIVNELLFTATYSVLFTFIEELPIFFKEKELYSVVIYYLVKVLSKIFQCIFYPFSFLFIMYITAPITINLTIFTSLWFIISIGYFTSLAYGFMFSAIFENLDYIHLLTIPMDTIFLVTTGIFLNLETLPYILKWMKYISSFYYTYEAVVICYLSYFDKIAKNASEDYYLNGINLDKNYYSNLYNLLLLGVAMHFIGCLAIFRRKQIN